MATWENFERAEPEFAALVRRVLDRTVTKVIATVRADGSPRVSGIEIEIEDGELGFGSMPDARKGADLRRDPRFALHSGGWQPAEPAEPAGRVRTAPAEQQPGDGMGDGDVKLSGRAVGTGALGGSVPGDGFRADLTEVVWTGLNEAQDRLVVRWWRPGEGVRTVERV